MKPKTHSKDTFHAELFRSRLEQILDLKHELAVLANKIDWVIFDSEFGKLYVSQKGRPGCSTRLLVGLHYLKHAFNQSDESVVSCFIENPYWQYFCGFEFFQHELPIHPSTLSRWRKRVGPAGIEKLFKETIQCALRNKVLKKTDIQKVNVDTTVQEKAIAFPTDARLYNKARKRLVKIAKQKDIVLRQSYVRVGNKAFVKQARYAHAKQMKRARSETRKLRTILGRLIRDIERKCENPTPDLLCELEKSKKLYHQKRHDKNKIYSLHAPEVSCIAKGKVHKRYEFGCKVSFVSTSKKNWLIGAKAFLGNPFDGHTLIPSLAQVTSITGMRPKEAFCDRGYRGKKNHPSDVSVHLSGKRTKSRSFRKWLKRRSAIEPIIGHTKQDNRMGRNFLKGTCGDEMNALLAACGFNFRKLLRVFFLSFFTWVLSLKKCPA